MRARLIPAEDAFACFRAKLPPTKDYPRDTMAVAVSTWREEFYQLKSGSHDLKKKTFSNAEDTLLADNVITQRNGLVWLVERNA